MKLIKAFLKIYLGVLLFFFMMINGAPHALASQQMAMHEHTSDSSSYCQSKCISNPLALSAPRQEPQNEEKDEPEPQLPEAFGGSNMLFESSISKKTNTVSDARLLRPPDLLAQYCLYRI